MSFEFAGDWGDSAPDLINKLANGKLPGKLGIIQDVISHWAIPRDERSIMRYGKAALDTFGTLYSYREDQKSERDEGSSPSRMWLKNEGYEQASPNRSMSFSSFIRRSLDGSDFRNKTVKVEGNKKRGRLIGVEINKDLWIYFLPDKSSNAEGTKKVGIWWDGPYCKPKDREAFASYIRERVWNFMGTKTIMLSATSNSYNAQIQLTALSDDLDFICGKDYHNDVIKIASRCKKFLDNKISRCLLFHGPPGTGKSTLALAIAKNLETRAVVIDHNVVRKMNKSSHMILWVLRPTVLILNDIDRGDTEEHKELLSALEIEHANDEHYFLTCLTVNDLTQLDPALLRPGRIHEIRKILEPSHETLELILDYYTSKMSLDLREIEKAEFLNKSTGFSPADIKEFCQTAKAVGVSLAIEELERIADQRKLYAGDKCKEFNEKK